MGGHGGLNILPQKSWNVYNYDNREKVRRDEEAAAKEEQIKREQSRKRDTELRVEKLRHARGLASRGPSQADEKPSGHPDSVAEPSKSESVAGTSKSESVAELAKSESDSRHINLFEGIRIFDPIKAGEGKRDEKKKGKFSGDDNKRNKKVKKEEVRTVGPEDEVYRLGYGVAGKGVKLPWYMEKRAAEEKKNGDDDDDDEYNDAKLKKSKSGGKKTLEELRQERLNREKTEKERALLLVKSKRDGGFSYKRR